MAERLAEGPPSPGAGLGGDGNQGERTGDVDGAEGSTPLPCQSSHKCTETATFPASARRTAYALQLNVQAMCERHGIERIGFLTLTFADHVLDAREAQRRMHSLQTHVLKVRYGNSIRVIERQKSGRIHYHLLVAVGADIRTGCDFDAFARRDYRSAPAELRREWAYWRATARKFGFGRTELLPVRSSKEAIGRYVGKYIAKHLDVRQREDRRVRLVSYTGDKDASTRFAWAGGMAARWRHQLGAFVRMLHEAGALEEASTKAMAKRFGPRWAYQWRDQIMTFPTTEDAAAVDQTTVSNLPAGVLPSTEVGNEGLIPHEDEAVSGGSVTAADGVRPADACCVGAGDLTGRCAHRAISGSDSGPRTGGGDR